MSMKTNLNQVTKTILLVDDERNVRDMLNDLLVRTYGDSLIIIQGESAETAHEVILNFQIDFIVCDFDLQSSSGLSVYSYFKKYKQEPKFIFFTGAKNLERYLPKMESFYQGIITKPNFNDVVKIVGNWLAENQF